MSDPKNVDDILVKTMSDQANGVVPNVSIEVGNPHASEEVAEHSEDVSRETMADNDDYLPDNAEKSTENKDVSRETISKSEEESPIDEYGNPVSKGKTKTFTQEEVNQIVRDRLARGRQQQAEPENHRPLQQTEHHQSEESDGNDWEEQLNTFIDRKLEQKQQQEQERSWREKESQKQAEFQDKFTSGMDRYGDFHERCARAARRVRDISVPNRPWRARPRRSAR